MATYFFGNLQAKPTFRFNMKYFSFILVFFATACVSSDEYNDLQHKNRQLETQLGRATEHKQVLQEFVDRHIKEFHEEGKVEAPNLGYPYTPPFVKDSEIRQLQIEINRLRRELEAKNKLIQSHQPPPATDDGVEFKVDTLKK